MNWQCTKCGKGPSKNEANNAVNMAHVEYKMWCEKGLKSFCWHCMKNTKQIVVKK